LGIHAGASYATQRWSTAYFAALVRKLSETNHDTVLIGSPADTALIYEIRARAGVQPLIFIDSDLRKAIALISKLKLLVCNNSGPLHIAAALEIPTVSFMGPTHKDRWYPLGGNHKVLRAEDLNCLGCEKGECPLGTHDCMQRILPISAYEAIERAIACR
jgi:heptosyltransferase-2